jgi:hypothetical protein
MGMSATQTSPVAPHVAGQVPPWHDRLAEPSLSVLVVLEIIGIFVVNPLNELGLSSGWLDLLLILLVLASALLIVWKSRVAVTVVIASFIAGILALILRTELPSSLTMFIDLGAKLTFLGTLTWIVGKGVFGPGRVTFHRIRGAVAIYLQISLIFTFLYLLLARLSPTAFSPPIVLTGPTGDILRGARGGATLIHFSLTTLTTVGYGDIIPVHPFARSLANLEALIGQLFPATILARLVTLEVESHRRT